MVAGLMVLLVVLISPPLNTTHPHVLEQHLVVKDVARHVVKRIVLTPDGCHQSAPRGQARVLRHNRLAGHLFQHL